MIKSNKRSIENANIQAVHNQQEILNSAGDHHVLARVFYDEDYKVQQVEVVLAEMLFLIYQVLHLEHNYWSQIFISAVYIYASRFQQL